MSCQYRERFIEGAASFSNSTVRDMFDKCRRRNVARLKELIANYDSVFLFDDINDIFNRYNLSIRRFYRDNVDLCAAHEGVKVDRCFFDHSIKVIDFFTKNEVRGARQGFEEELKRRKKKSFRLSRYLAGGGAGLASGAAAGTIVPIIGNKIGAIAGVATGLTAEHKLAKKDFLDYTSSQIDSTIKDELSVAENMISEIPIYVAPNIFFSQIEIQEKEINMRDLPSDISKLKVDFKS